MVPVTREEFKIRSELEAVHLPTETVASASTRATAAIRRKLTIDQRRDVP